MGGCHPAEGGGGDLFEKFWATSDSNLVDRPENVPMLQIHRDSHLPASLPKLLLYQAVVHCFGNIHFEYLHILGLLAHHGDPGSQIGDIDVSFSQDFRNPVNQARTIFSLAMRPSRTGTPIARK